MNIENRRKKIITILAEHRRVKVRDLSEQLKVSDDTVRRDLDYLAEEGFLQKTHGGAVSLDVPNLPRHLRTEIASTAKAEIAHKASQLLPGNSVIFFDAGHTTLETALRLPPGPFTIITTSLDIAVRLSDRKDIRLIIIGGEWDRSQRLIKSSSTVEAIKLYRVDLLVMGACAIDQQDGVTATDDWDAAAKRAMIGISEKKMLVADQSKMGRKESYFVANLDEFDWVITNDRK